MGGCSVMSLEIASDAFPFTEVSSHLPSRMKVISIADVSKHGWSRPRWSSVASASTVKKTE